MPEAMTTASDFWEIHVDETGDRGFGSKSSRYFFLTACAFKHSDASTILDGMNELNQTLERPSSQPIHAVKHLKTHHKLLEAVECLARLPIQIIYVVLPKHSTPRDAAMRDNVDQVYNFLVRLMLERMSWFGRDHRLPVKPVFASVRRMPRSLLDSYIEALRHRRTEMAWSWLRLPVEVLPARDRVGLQWADIAGRAIWRAVEAPSQPPRRTEPLYLEALAPVIWPRQPIASYGIKSVQSGWGEAQPWWPGVTERIPTHG